MCRAAVFLILLATLALSSQAALAARHVFQVQSDPHLRFAREICLEALRKAGVDASFEPFPPAPEKRLAAEMASGKLHLAFIPPNADRLALEAEERVAAIRIPMERGLLGFRICLVRGAAPDMLAGVKTAEDLRRFTVGQGLGWADIDVYRLAGIPVAEAPFAAPTDPLRALAAGNFDLLPLGLSEYEAFLTRYDGAAYGVVADRHIVIRYPWYRYVWVSRTAPDSGILLAGLRKGLEIMAKDGSFIRMFEQSKGRFSLESLQGRTVIDLQSPYAKAYDIEPPFRGLLADPR